MDRGTWQVTVPGDAKIQISTNETPMHAHEINAWIKALKYWK